MTVPSFQQPPSRVTWPNRGHAHRVVRWARGGPQPRPAGSWSALFWSQHTTALPVPVSAGADGIQDGHCVLREEDSPKWSHVRGIPVGGRHYVYERGARRPRPVEAAVGAGTVKAGVSLDRPAMFPGHGPQRAGGSSRVGLVSQATPPLTL